MRKSAGLISLVQRGEDKRDCSRGAFFIRVQRELARIIGYAFGVQEEVENAALIAVPSPFGGEGCSAVPH
jgi:hypothetical protein